jgi:hypothetical protein
MTDQSNLEHLEEAGTAKTASLTEGATNAIAGSDEHQADAEKHGINRSTKAAKSKREIMEDLSRERFPWEE